MDSSHDSASSYDSVFSLRLGCMLSVSARSRALQCAPSMWAAVSRGFSMLLFSLLIF